MELFQPKAEVFQTLKTPNSVQMGFLKLNLVKAKTPTTGTRQSNGTEAPKDVHQEVESVNRRPTMH